MDIHPERMNVMAEFCRRFMRWLGHEIPLRTTTNLSDAVVDARFILTQIRVGGNVQRILDEKIPLRYGLIGQETTGPGGMFKALRTIPAMLEIAREVEMMNPKAWIINYSNPTGLVTEAITRYTSAQIVGLCAGGSFPRQAVVKALGVPGDSVTYDYFGLNHLNFAFNLRVNGCELTEVEFNRVAETAPGGAVNIELIKSMRMIPSPYLQYYFHRIGRVHDAQEKENTRGEEVRQLEAEVFAAYADPAQTTKPAALARRGGGGYSEIALGVMSAIYNNRERNLIVNAPNHGAVRLLPDEAVLEIPCLVSASGITPLVCPRIPELVWGLVSAVKNYESLAVEAAVTGSREMALMALLAHPLVGDYELAMKLFDVMLEANRNYLPQFFS